MPTYEYHCKECGNDFSVRMTIKEHDKHQVICPSCKSGKVKHKLERFFAKTSRKS